LVGSESITIPGLTVGGVGGLTLFSLPKGTYLINAFASSLESIGNNYINLTSVDGSTVYIPGSSSVEMGSSSLQGTMKVEVGVTVVLTHYVEATGTAIGPQALAGFPANVYDVNAANTTISFIKIR
jgi:hypothetical protein